MNLTLFYQEQAVRQQQTAADATLQNVRERAQRAADAWSNLAARSERADDERAQAASNRSAAELGENSDCGSASV